MRREAGLTLVELLVALVLLALLLGSGVPAFTDTIRRNRLALAAGEFLGIVHYTRSAAIERNRRVTLCVSPDGDRCAPEGGWEKGWLVFVDDDGDGQRDGGETVLRHGDTRGGGLVITANSPVRRYISYVGQGGSRTTSGALQMGTITICAKGEARRIVISGTGRPRIENGTC